MPPVAHSRGLKERFRPLIAAKVTVVGGKIKLIMRLRPITIMACARSLQDRRCNIKSTDQPPCLLPEDKRASANPEIVARLIKTVPISTEYYEPLYQSFDLDSLNLPQKQSYSIQTKSGFTQFISRY
jgi:hypothetical protein